MGRREVAAVSSPISAESSFRKLDDVFLQTQTRVWLSEVLNIRLLNEELHISDLLADGDLLYEVSKVVWDMLLAKCPELRHLKNKPLHSQKSSGRFRPYSNVDSFLKICKILGLNSIDLFSPSDVVEKRNIRKVCICIRTLSKKARSKHLKVPDFDMVTYTVAMPKDMVGCIRRSLETSQYSFSSSSSHSSYKDQRLKVEQKNLTESGDKNYDSCSEESDEAESKYMGKDPCFSSTNNINYIPTWNSDCENSPGAHSAAAENAMHFDHVNFESKEGNYISDYLAFSDSVICGTNVNNPVLLEGEDNIFNFFTGIDSRWPSSGQHVLDSDETEDLEVSSTASMSSLLGRVLNLDFDDHVDIDGSLNEHLGFQPEVISQCQDECKSGLDCNKGREEDDHKVIPSISYEEKHSLSPIKESDEADRKHRDMREKASRMTLLQTVARGTAIFGAMFLLLHHLSRRGREKNSDDPNKKQPQNKKLKGRDISYRNGNRERIYPAEKLKFKN